MLRWAVVFAVLAIIVGVFGLANITVVPSPGSRTAFFSLLGVGAVLFALGFMTPRR